MTLGDKIRNIRVLRGYSQENMAHMLNITRLAYGSVERNKIKMTIDRLEQIAFHLHVQVFHIFNFENIFRHFFDRDILYNRTNPDYDYRQLEHIVEKQQLEIKKLKAEMEKSQMEIKYWKEKYGF